LLNHTRLVIVGDELVAGAGDPRGQGWVGRVLARTEPPGSATPYVLAVPGETTTALSERWQREALLRFQPDGPNRLVIGLGWADLDAGISINRARLSLANILNEAADLQIPTMVVGPPPRRPEEHDQLAEYSRAFAEATTRRGSPYIETLNQLANHEQWIADMQASGYTWPGQYGYGLIAWLVFNSPWNEWLK